MTTEPRPRRPAPRLDLSGREWKLYLLGGLGLAYAASLSAIASQARPAAGPPLQPPAASVGGLTAGSGRSVVWLDQLPVADRPPVALPPGWVLATPSGQAVGGSAVLPAPPALPGTPSASAQAQTVQRAPRILTRTS
jgi:hypothetical protein